MKRQRNHGVRKVCGCGRSKWAKCRHSWYLNFKPKGETKHYRLSIDRVLLRHVETKIEAEAEADKIRTAIRDGKFRLPGAPDERPIVERLTIRRLLSLHSDAKLNGDGTSATNRRLEIATITRTPIELRRARRNPLATGWLRT